jgi:hypothetical protein
MGSLTFSHGDLNSNQQISRAADLLDGLKNSQGQKKGARVIDERSLLVTVPDEKVDQTRKIFAEAGFVELQA